MDLNAFLNGEEFSAYEFFGGHLTRGGARFRVYAPHAKKVWVLGTFSDWEPLPMKRARDRNSFWLSVKEAREGDRYMFRILGKDGETVDHTDPFAFGMELRPDAAAVLRSLKGYKWHDARWIEKRSTGLDRPVNIYEIHPGSWKKKGTGLIDWYSYRELAPLLIRYLKAHHFTHVEFTPLTEYPSDESWGYQTTGFFAPTARYGDPDGLRFLIDSLHKAGIGAILDFVSVHFAMDRYALAHFDGTPLFEETRDGHAWSEWGSYNFDFTKPVVRSVLNSSAAYWLREFHFDGLRLDAVSNLVYPHGDSSQGENKPGVRFLRTLTQGLRDRFPNICLIAEDSTTFPYVTRPVREGGLGFDYKWDLGWMHDTLDFFSIHPYDRPQFYNKLSFSMWYFHSENFLLPFSHDEVVHMKGTISTRMNEDSKPYARHWKILRLNRFRELRTLYVYMFTHPGKKLNFMGNELATDWEWDEKRDLHWDHLDNRENASFHRFFVKLCAFYKATPALWERDYEEAGFRWTEVEQSRPALYAFARFARDGSRVLTVLNLSDRPLVHYELTQGLLREGRIMLSSNTGLRQRPLERVQKEGERIFLDLPGLTGVILA